MYFNPISRSIEFEVGTHIILLSIVDASGNTATYTTILEILANDPPVQSTTTITTTSSISCPIDSQSSINNSTSEKLSKKSESPIFTTLSFAIALTIVVKGIGVKIKRLDL